MNSLIPFDIEAIRKEIERKTGKPYQFPALPPARPPVVIKPVEERPLLPEKFDIQPVKEEKKQEQTVIKDMKPNPTMEIFEQYKIPIIVGSLIVLYFVFRKD